MADGDVEFNDKEGNIFLSEAQNTKDFKTKQNHNIDVGSF